MRISENLLVRFIVGPFFLLASTVSPVTAQDRPSPTIDAKNNHVADRDLELFQGTWELVPDASNSLKYRSVQTIKGNTSKVRRYDVASGELVREHTASFEMLTEGKVRINRFRISDSLEFSYIYKVTKDYYYEATGLLDSEDDRSHTNEPKFYRWKRSKKTPETQLPQSHNE